MGFFRKIAFWKTDDDLGFEGLADQEAEKDNLGLDDNLGLNRKPVGLDERSPFEELDEKNPVAPPPPHLDQLNNEKNKDLEIINSKLDTLKAILLSLDQRVAGLERPVAEKKEKLW